MGLSPAPHLGAAKRACYHGKKEILFPMSNSGNERLKNQRSMSLDLDTLFPTPMTSTKKKRVAIYARVSTIDKAQDPENQLRVLS